MAVLICCEGIIISGAAVDIIILWLQLERHHNFIITSALFAHSCSLGLYRKPRSPTQIDRKKRFCLRTNEVDKKKSLLNAQVSAASTHPGDTCLSVRGAPRVASDTDGSRLSYHLKKRKSGRLSTIGHDNGQLGGRRASFPARCICQKVM